MEGMRRDVAERKRCHREVEMGERDWLTDVQ